MRIYIQVFNCLNCQQGDFLSPPNIFVAMNSTSCHQKPYMYRHPFAHTTSVWNALPGYETNMTTPSTFKNAFLSSLYKP